MKAILWIVLAGLWGCQEATDSDPSEEDGSASGTLEVGNLSDEATVVVDESPSLQMELDSQAVTAGVLSVDTSLTAEVGDNSIGGCMAWAVRKRAKVDTSDLQFVKCLVTGSSQKKALTDSDGLYQFKIWDLKIPTKITATSEQITVSMCLPPNANHEVPTSETLRLTLSRAEGELAATNPYFTVTGTRYVEGDGFERFVESQIETSENKEDYSYTVHVVNETSEELCQGASGTEVGSEDSTCFHRLEGTAQNDRSGDETISLFQGMFAEKNHVGVRTNAAVYALFREGIGASKFAVGLPQVDSNPNDQTTLETWNPLEFKVATTDESLTALLADAVLSQRTVAVPAIADPWDCALGDTPTYIDYDLLTDASVCSEEHLNFPDITNCGGGDEELAEQVENFLCDDEDPLTRDDGIDCP